MSEEQEATYKSWSPVVGYEGLYEISPYGDVRNIRTSRSLRQHTINGGYQVVQLWRHNRPQTCLVHRLVAMSFLGPIPDGKEVNHRDGNKKHNAVTNLEYMTRSENNQHAYVTGLHPSLSGTHHKLSPEAVSEICREYSVGMCSMRELGRRFGVSHQTIGSVVRGHDQQRKEWA